MKPLFLICALVLSGAVVYAQGSNAPDTDSSSPRAPQFQGGMGFGQGQGGMGNKMLTKEEASEKIARALTRTDEMLARLAQTKQELLAKQAQVANAPEDAQFSIADIMPQRQGPKGGHGPRDMMKTGASQMGMPSGSEPPPPAQK